MNTNIRVTRLRAHCRNDHSAQEADDTILMVLPNPASDKIEVLFSEPIYFVKLYTITGALIKKELLNGFIDISDLQKGVYFISVNHRYHHKFLKQ